MEKGIPFCFRQLGIDRLTGLDKLFICRQDPFCFPVVQHAVGVRLDMLRLAPAVVLDILPNYFTHGFPDFRAEFPFRPTGCKLHQIVFIPFMDIIGQIQKEFGGYFMAFQIPHIHNPDPVNSIVVGHPHLFPDLGERDCIQPPVRLGPTHIVKVIVHAVSTGAVSFGFLGDHPDIAEVIIGQKNGDIIRDIDPRFPEFLDFFVQGKYLGGLGCALTGNVRQDLPLIGNDPFHHCHPFLQCAIIHHGLVAITPHANGHQLFTILADSNPIAPKLKQVLPVFAVIPFTSAVLLPFHPTAHHRLVMGSGHDNAIFISQFSVERIIPIKVGRFPHGRPQQIPLQP